MSKQPNGTPGKKPPAPSIKRRLVRSFSTMVEILKSQKPEQTEAEPHREPKPVPVRRGRA